MTTGYNDDDDDDKRASHPPAPPPHSHYASSYPPYHFSSTHDESEAKRKQDADTHYPLPRSLLPSSSPPPPNHSAYLDYKEEKQSLSPASAARASQQHNPLPPHPFRPCFAWQWLDVCDTEGVWLEAQVVALSVAGTHVKVHYKGYKHKYDEWLDASPSHPHSARIAPLHAHTLPKWPLPQRPVLPLTADGDVAVVLPAPIDCLDTTDKWLPAHVVGYDTQHGYALLSYDGWTAEFNEWINLGSYRLAPPHTHTTATSGKFVNVTTHHSPPPPFNNTAIPQPCYAQPPPAPIVDTEPRYSASLDNEARFRSKLRTLGLGVVEQEQDGNCLFRSVSHQLYDSGDYHAVVRETCMRYIDGEAAYFRAFVVGDFDAYVARMCRSGEWGDHVEIQALSEVYDLPIEIYAYSTHPLRTYSRQDSTEGSTSVSDVRRPVMRLSYHFASHYNSVVEAGRLGGLLDGRPVGEVEDESIERQRRRRDEQQHEDALQRSLRVSRSQFGASSSVSEFDRAVADSLREMEAEEERKVEEVKRESEREAVERDEMELVLQQSVEDEMQHELEQAEQAELNTALQSSLSTAAGTSSVSVAPQQAPDDEEEELRRAVQLSLQANRSTPPPASAPAVLTSAPVSGGGGAYPSAVQKLLDVGFPLESCVSAYSVFEGGGEGEEVLVQSMMEYMLAQRS